MKNLIKEKGITLVSLVITVVVLMFLAGIIITTNSENNGVLNIAKDKKEETEKMTIEESIKIQLEEDSPANYSELIEFLKGYGKIENEEVPDEAVLVTTNGNYIILVKDIWNIEKQKLGISVGDYVQYSYDGGNYTVNGTDSGTNQEQTLNIANSTGSTWRVIDVNKQSEQIKIIPANLNNYSVTLSGANGFNNGVKILNDICNKLFSNIEYGATARNINIEDIEKISSNIQELKGTSYGTEKKYNSILYPRIVKQENDASLQNELFYGTENSNSLSLMQTFYGGNIVYTNSDYKNIILNGSYWVSSRAINNSDNDAAEYCIRTLNIASTVNLDGKKLFDSKGQSNSGSYNILPVVTLKSTKFNEGNGTQENPYKL